MVSDNHNNHNNKILMSMLLALTLLIVVPMASAAITVTFVSPLTGSNNSGTMIVNCTSNIQESVNASLVYASDGTTADTWVLLDTIAIANESEFYAAAFDISSFTDAATYNMTCAVYNDTDYYYSTAIPVITIDNTAPVITSTVGAGQVDYMTPTTLTCSATDAIDSATTITRTLTKADTSTVTITSSPYTTTGSDINVLGAYTWTCSAVDDSGNTGTTELTFQVDTDDDAVVSSTSVTSTDTTDKSNMPFILVVILLVGVIAAIGVYAYTNKK